MMGQIVSRASIEEHADRAATEWVADPQKPKPRNPYLHLEQPDHRHAWATSFERSLVLHSAQDVEQSA